MANLEQYANKYETINFERHNGILQVTFHSRGESLKWGGPAHREFGNAFADIGSDPSNRVVILTGTGDDFCAGYEGTRPPMTPIYLDTIYWEGKRLLTNLLDIEVPVIGAVNGPALVHAEIPVLSDIVLASETATFQDATHFPSGLVPGDGVHVVWPLLLGQNRGRYFLLTGQTLSAQEAKSLVWSPRSYPGKTCCPEPGNWRNSWLNRPTLLCATAGWPSIYSSSVRCRTCWVMGWQSKEWPPLTSKRGCRDRVHSGDMANILAVADGSAR